MSERRGNIGGGGMKLLDRLARWWLSRRLAQQTMVFCPTCGLELCNTQSFISDTDLVRYQCIQCKTRSAWLFDAPVPILIGVGA